MRALTENELREFDKRIDSADHVLAYRFGIAQGDVRQLKKERECAVRDGEE